MRRANSPSTGDPIQMAERSEDADSDQLIEDDTLAGIIQVVAGQSAAAADEFTMLILCVADSLDGRAPRSVRNTLRRSVELAFHYSDASRAAFELYVRDKRGLVESGSASDLIWELVRTRSSGLDGED
jgi:hypothetical protein